MNTLRFRYQTIATATALSFILVFATVMPASADYQLIDVDYPTTGNSLVYVWDFPESDARAEIGWYVDGLYVKGVFYNTYIVGTGGGGGCIFVKVTWNKIGGDLSWPPSVNEAGVSDGYWYSCRPNRSAAIPYLTLGDHTYDGNIQYTSRLLTGVTLELCTAFSIRHPKGCTANRFSAGQANSQPDRAEKDFLAWIREQPELLALNASLSQPTC